MPGQIESRRPRRVGIRAWTAWALSAALLAAVLAAQALAEQKSIAGQMLVASETMGDPRFAETVIYMIEHDQTGALGLVVNRPLGDVPLANLLERMGHDPETAAGSIAVHTGGPVEPGRVFILHSTEVMAEDSTAISGDIALTAGPEMLRLLGRGAGPKHSLFFVGYAGWGPGQLDGELARADWFVIPGAFDLVFAAKPAQSWRAALQRRGVDL